MHLSTLKKQIKALRLTSVGHISHDVFEEEMYIGGSAYFSTRIAHELGSICTLVSSVGQDFLFDEELNQFDQVYLHKEGKTTTFINEYSENHRTQFVRSCAEAISTHQYEFKNAGCDVLFIAPILNEIDSQHALDFRSIFHPKKTVLNLQGYLKGAEKSSLNQSKKVVAKPFDLPLSFLQKMDMVFLSDEDLHLFCQPHVLSDLIENIPLVYVTLGEKGCMLYEHQLEILIPAFATPQVVDPTGAGDTFAISTALALSCGLSAFHAACFGHAAASIIIEGQGASNASSIHQVYTRFEHHLRSITV